MAIRFIDTSFYKSPFVRGLQGPMKALYSFIICDCSNAGIWSADFEVASLYIGFKIKKDEFNEAFIKTNKAIDLNNGRFFFPAFIDHQYPKGLHDNNKAHINVISELSKYQLIENLGEGSWKLLARGLEGAQDTDKEKDKETGKEKEPPKQEPKHPLQVYIAEKCPEVSKLKTQLTYEEAVSLTGQFNNELIKGVLADMENKPNFAKSYKVVYTTLKNWIGVRQASKFQPPPKKQTLDDLRRYKENT